MTRITHPHLLPENDLILRKKDRYKKATRCFRYPMVILGGLLFVFFCVASLHAPLKSIIPEPARWACLFLSSIFLLVPGLIYLWIWLRFRLPIDPLETEYQGARGAQKTLKTSLFDTSELPVLSYLGGWDEFWRSTISEKARFIWLNVVFWTMSVGRRNRECDSSVGKETARGENTRLGDVEAALERLKAKRTWTSWEHGGAQPRRPVPVEMTGLPRSNRHQASEVHISTCSQAVAVQLSKPRNDVRFQPWNISNNPLLSDPWRLGLPGMRITPAPDTDAMPHVLNGANDKPAKVPTIRIEPATIDSLQEAAIVQDRAQRGKPSAFSKRFRAKPIVNPTNGTRRTSSTHGMKTGIMRRIRLLRPGVELYRRLSPTRGPSASLQRLASCNKGLLQPEAAKFVLDAGRKKHPVLDGM